MSSTSSSRDRGASDGRVAMLVTVCLIILAIPGAFVLHEMLLPKLPSVGPIAGTSPLPIGSAPIVDSPGITSPPPAASSSALAAPPTSPAPSIAAAAPPPPAASPSLPSLGYAVPAAAPGYVVSVDPGGRVLDGSTTLDLCEIRFASESKRIARLAVDYTDTNGLGPSLEVAEYAPGGASLAYTELINGVKRCPLTYHEGDSTVTKTVVEPPDDSLLSLQMTVIQYGTIDGTHAWLATIYQFDGPYLLVVYSNLNTTEAGASGTAVYLARVAAAQLQRALTGSSQPIISG